MKKIQAYESAVQKGILLNANENPYPVLPQVIEAAIQAVSETAFSRYPDSSQQELLQAYSGVIGIDADQILAGNGSDQMLGYLIGTYLGKGKTLCTLDPDFSMYDYYAGSYEAEVIRFTCEKDGSFDVDEMIRFASQKQADMILFSNPNNPSGHCLSVFEIEKIAGSFSIPVVIDEAYMEFSDETSALTLLEKYDNLYVTRTLSKAYGMAGLRVGFLISCRKNMERLKTAFVPYALNSVSMKIAAAALSYASCYEKQIEEIKRERNRVYEALLDCKRLHMFPSSANFLYGISDDKQEMIAALKEKNIVIRDYAGSSAFRITIGTPEENDLVLSILKEFEEGK